MSKIGHMTLTVAQPLATPVADIGCTVMTEHPAWWPTPDGPVRVFRTAAGDEAVRVGREGRRLPGTAGGPVPDTFEVAAAGRGPMAELVASLSALGPVVRYRNPDLWDALATAVVRQVIRAGQSKRLYRAFADRFGDRADAGAGRSLPMFPGHERVLELSDEAFASHGMAFKKRPLRNAAAAYARDGKSWRSLPARDLVEALQSVPGIGPWTASAAVADFTNDWSVYPHGDLAVRTWAKRAAPSTPWPDNDADFASLWRRCAGPDLSALTVLVLAWGSRRGDIG